jgi:hypothetical protein
MPTTAANSYGWYNGAVSVHFTCSDALSGISSCEQNHTITTQGFGNSVNGTAEDRANNTMTASVVGINIDSTNPVVAITGVTDGAVYTLGAVPTASCAASDGGSGLAGTCSGSVTGATAGGVGTFTYAVAVTDRAGNTSRATATFRVIYRFDGFLQPINDTAHQIGATTSIFKSGSTVPVKLQLRNAGGLLVEPRSLPEWIAPVKGSSTAAPIVESVYTDAVTTGSTFRYDAGNYIFNWGTTKAQTNYYWRIGVRLDDGQTYFVNIGLR